MDTAQSVVAPAAAAPMRIAQVSPYGLDRYGGVRSHIAGLGRALVARGHHVTVIAPGGDDMLEELPVFGCGPSHPIRFGGTVFDAAWATRTATQRVRDARFDVLHVHTPWNPVVPLQLTLAHRGVRVATFHDVPSDTTPWLARTLMPIAAAALRRYIFDAVIGVSPAVGSYLGAGRYEEIPNGVKLPRDLNPTVGANVEPNALTALCIDAPIVAYIGRLEPRKDVNTLLTALGLLAARRPDVPALVILGDGPLRSALESEARRLTQQFPAVRVHFLGASDDAVKWQLLALATALVAPSTSGESFGIVLLEAMAARTIPIAADNPGYRAVLADPTGLGASLLFAAGNPAALADRLARLLDDGAWRDAVRALGVTRWPAFTWERIAERIEGVYANALAGANARRMRTR